MRQLTTILIIAIATMAIMPKAHARFSRVFQFHETSTNAPQDEQIVRDALSTYAPPGSRLDQILFVLDQDVNRSGRHYINVLIDPDLQARGKATPSTIYLKQGLWWFDTQWVFMHELGHVLDWRFGITPTRTEQWADDFANWVMAGQPNGPTWNTLQPLLED